MMNNTTTEAAPANIADVAGKLALVSEFHRAALELDWAKHGHSKTANKRFDTQLKKLLTALLGRKPTQDEIDCYNAM